MQNVFIKDKHRQRSLLAPTDNPAERPEPIQHVVRSLSNDGSIALQALRDSDKCHSQWKVWKCHRGSPTQRFSTLVAAAEHRGPRSISAKLSISAYPVLRQFSVLILGLLRLAHGLTISFSMLGHRRS